MPVLRNQPTQSTDPAVGVEGQVYYNSATKKLRVYAGGQWQDLYGTNGFGNRTVSSSDPSGGQDGDIWYQV